jgi:hypothetical protein
VKPTSHNQKLVYFWELVTQQNKFRNWGTLSIKTLHYEILFSYIINTLFNALCYAL